MAAIELRSNSKEKYYRITVTNGKDPQGKALRHRKNWFPPADMSPEQAEKEVKRIAAEFEMEVKGTPAPPPEKDEGITLEEYIAVVLSRLGKTSSSKTISNYQYLAQRIVESMGSFPVKAVTPRNIQVFMSDLANAGRRKNESAVLKSDVDLAAISELQFGSKAAMAAACRVSSTTLSQAMNGASVSEESAIAIAKGVRKQYEELFDECYNSEPLSFKTQKEHFSFLSLIFKEAVRDEIIEKSPIKAEDAPQKSREQRYAEVQAKKEKALSQDQYKAIACALVGEPAKWRALIGLLLETGTRRGEAVGLRWENVDLVNGMITIEESLITDSIQGVHSSITKNGVVRTIGISPLLVSWLKAWQEEQSELRDFQEAWKETGFVFTQNDGDRIHPDSVNKWLTQFCKRHGLPHVHPHQFRHSIGSFLIAQGHDPQTVAAELGDEIHTVLEVYVHPVTEARQRAAKTRAELFESALKNPQKE